MEMFVNWVLVRVDSGPATGSVKEKVGSDVDLESFRNHTCEGLDSGPDLSR